MDESDNLEALSNLLTRLSSNPYDLSLHIQHVRLASATGMDEQVNEAREMFANFYAVPDEIWVPLIEAKEKAVDLATAEGVKEILELYERAEGDYLSIPILRKHIQFLIDRHTFCLANTDASAELKELFSTEATLSAISSVVSKGVGHVTESHLLWDLQRDWEHELLERAQGVERELLIGHLHSAYLTRLQQPHCNHDETFQSYSTFTTNYKSPQEYESLLVSASKLRSRAVKAYERRESYESQLRQSKYALETYASYIASERRARNPDAFILTALYERAIAEAAKRGVSEDMNAAQVLRMFWIGYCDFLRQDDAEDTVQLKVLKRATRSVPGSGEVWARYFRFLEKIADDEEPDEDLDIPENVADAYTRAMSTNLIQKDVEQIIPVVLARAGHWKRQIMSGKAEPDLEGLIKVLEEGIAMVRKSSKTGDSGGLRLEKYLADMYVNLFELPDRAAALWEATAKHYKTSYLAWTLYAEALIKQNQYDQARAVYVDVSTKNVDWPEAIWQAWLSFEHLYGSVDEIERCMDKVERAQGQVNARRAREAEKASYQAYQMATEQQATSVPVAEVPPPQAGDNAAAPAAGEAMDVDVPTSVDGGSKRKADESPAPEGSKRPRMESRPPTLKRDRENCTVFVTELPPETTEAELRAMFKDCGDIREIKVTNLPDAVVATVEFSERESVPAALTKDKKRIREQEIAVNMAWQSTLYVTNFPEKADDAFIRDIFGKYGQIFETRWPSKKFKNTRRFVYVQYISPSSAKEALLLHGIELEPGLPLNVYISNPERKKERTDADADAREVYVAGLSKFTTKEDLEKIFRTYGPVKDIRMAQDESGRPKGFAFVEYELEKDALAALAANNHELKGRRIAVTLADTRRAKKSHEAGSRSEVRSRSVRLRNLPPGTQEGLLQQALEKIARVKRVEVFANLNEAVAELDNPAEAGKLLLLPNPITFNGNVLDISEETGSGSRPAAPPPKAGGLFVPRAAVSRPRAGLGKQRKPVAVGSQSSSQTPSSGAQGVKGQDDFRKMLGGG
ncbi:hypothetical protein GLOTRDRAFT_66218 [Gloeophyllum trabeum ATCC 11539]|uniref:U4/U6 snRNA-associated-splicing factor PRP24 n=1 Tax=Gloeophyllum trabeum (strain ATCC 11539 / FP-39264 / Madison 617) TaxID=670483 RepID=S7PUS0_GLOTA|nr:uncharacterized protein GLOTRDRAFT_66218 [Gloeophyllum trabeum ATCC 11539]EPQ51022.1 hypothetical protein GLOTRDRAFT_66218 [Gloeophyllum trabeum ATCC 11539]